MTCQNCNCQYCSQAKVAAQTLNQIDNQLNNHQYHQMTIEEQREYELWKKLHHLTDSELTNKILNDKDEIEEIFNRKFLALTSDQELNLKAYDDEVFGWCSKYRPKITNEYVEKMRLLR